MEKENIYNIPNFLTLLRVISAPIVAYLIFSGFSIYFAIAVFIFGMLTDFFDGQIARRFNLKTEFGRQFDIIADRILIIGSALAIVIKLELIGSLSFDQFFQLLFMFSREIMTLPIFLVTLWFKTALPQVRMIGKITTFAQSIAFPLIVLSNFYPIFKFSWFFAIATGICGLVAAVYYIFDMVKLIKNKIYQVK